MAVAVNEVQVQAVLGSPGLQERLATLEALVQQQADELRALRDHLQRPCVGHTGLADSPAAAKEGGEFELEDDKLRNAYTYGLVMALYSHTNWRAAEAMVLLTVVLFTQALISFGFVSIATLSFSLSRFPYDNPPFDLTLYFPDTYVSLPSPDGFEKAAPAINVAVSVCSVLLLALCA